MPKRFEQTHNFVDGWCTVCGEDEHYYNVHNGLEEPDDTDLPFVAAVTDDNKSDTYPWNSATSDSDGKNG